MKNNIKVLHPAEAISITPPGNDDGSYHIAGGNALTLPEVRLHELTNVRMLPDGCVFDGLTAVEDSFLLTTDGFVRTHNRKGLLALRLKWKTQRLAAAKTYLLAYNTYRGYFHLLAETVPRLFLVRDRLPQLTLLLPASYRNDTFLYILSLAGIDADAIEWVEDRRIYAVPHLLLVGTTAQQQHYNPELMHTVREAFILRSGAVKDSRYPPKIYVTRKPTSRRRVLNESEVAALMVAHGYTCVDFEDLHFSEQIRYCLNAEIMVSIHGAGLTNCMFMEPGSRLLEFRKDDNGEIYYYHSLASAMGVDYLYQFCAVDDPAKPVNTANLYVDIALLKQNLSLLARTGPAFPA